MNFWQDISKLFVDISAPSKIFGLYFLRASPDNPVTQARSNIF